MREKKWSNLMEAWLKTPVTVPVPSNQAPIQPHRPADADLSLLSDGTSCLDTLDLDFSQLDRQRIITAQELRTKFPDFEILDPASTHVTLWFQDHRGSRMLLSSFTVAAVVEHHEGVRLTMPEGAKSVSMQLHQGRRISAEVPL